MATASGSGRSRRGVVRSSRSKVSSRHHKSKPAVDEAAVVKKPDVDEIRQLRAAYFGRPVAERQKVIRPKTGTVSLSSTKSSKSGAVKEGQQLRKKRSSKSSSIRSSKVPSESERRTADYVYGPPPTAPVPRDGPASVRSEEIEDETKTIRSDKRRHSRRHSSSHKLPAVAESEVTPDDSISVVAERRYAESRKTSTRSQSSMKRSSTTSSRLAPISEDASGDTSRTASHRASKREPSLIGSILRRQSTTSVPAPPRLVECLTCGSDDVPHPFSAKLACGHRMCHDCLKRVFEMSVKDPAHMPPRCCTEDHIPLKHVDKLFDVKFKILWNRKYQEYNTKNRIYCPAPRCGEWIKPSHIHKDSRGRKVAQCPRCKTKVCTLCNNEMHRSRDCPKDPEIAKLIEQAKEKGWQRCFSCNSMVELKEGCNHMTCRCLAEFCMICGAEWKTCDCPWFNYANLPNLGDRLNEMRVPEPIQILYRRVFDAAGRPAEPPAPAAAEQRNHGRERTYQGELEQRRRQERLDRDLAQRLQLASFFDPEDDPGTRRGTQAEPPGIGNVAGHFMNHDFVQNAANVVMDAFGDVNFGRRGERASGRRRRARETEQTAGDAGLAPNFLGTESVLGGAARH